MKFSKVQYRAIGQIEAVISNFGIDRWFTQHELKGVGYHTMVALVNKQYLRTKEIDFVNYYQVIVSADIISDCELRSSNCQR